MGESFRFHCGPVTQFSFDPCGSQRLSPVGKRPGGAYGPTVGDKPPQSDRNRLRNPPDAVAADVRIRETKNVPGR